VSNQGLSSLAFPPGASCPSLMAIAGKDGATHLLQLSDGLVTPAANEKAAMAAVSCPACLFSLGGWHMG
jgi:hypothetical protein